MAILFICEQCGHRVRAEDAQAGRRARCAHCGHKMMIPGTRIHHHEHDQGHDLDQEEEVEFRLAPLDDEPAPPSRVDASIPESEIGLEPIETPSHGEPKPRLRPADEGPRFGAVPVELPEELLADRSPIPLDPNFVPAPLSVSHDHTSQTLISVKARMYRSVRAILQKIECIENWLYVASLVFLMIAIVGLMLEYRPLAHFGAAWVLLCSILLAALGGVDVVIKPFQFGILGTSWKTMKKQIRHALAAFIPLIVLFLSYLFIKPIRDYFLDTAEARQAKQMSSISSPIRERGDRPVLRGLRVEIRVRT